MGVLCLVLCVAGRASAQGVFLPANDVRLRDDLALLADSGLIHVAVNEWPLARADVAQAIAQVDSADVEPAALRDALARVAAQTAAHGGDSDWRIRQVQLTAGQPALLRDFATLGRENGELTTTGGMSNDRYGITLAATGVVDPNDGQHLRFDGSDASVRWGNWLLSVNQIDRWWGPGRSGSLILSTNARPMPAVSLDRIRSLPVDLPVLRLLGPWRFSWFFGLGERHRPDVDQPAFMGMRLSFKPSPWVEFGMSRSAQFCGKGRNCNLGTFGRLLIGQDNVYYRGLNNPDEEPGNQMSGFDLRLVSPFRSIPVAVYGQAIGEDNSNLSLPIRYLYQGGLESWWALGSGAVVRAFIEHTDTSTGLYELWKHHDWQPGFRTDFAYRNHIFFAGYRYRGRTIGDSTDSDSETTAIGLSLTGDSGDRWALQWRGGRLDRRGVPDIYNPITYGPSRYHSLQLSWEGRVAGQEFGAQIGHERQWPATAGNANGLFGFLQWRKTLD